MADNNTNEQKQNLRPYLSPIGVWALSFGCAVGWGSFVMPGTTFLPLAGPVGTVLGMLLGCVVMLIIGVNYCYLIRRYPDCGGTYTFTKNEMGYDHGFLSTWFLILVYLAIVWANATAIPLICRKIFGGLFQFGFHYNVAGYDIYFGEILLCIFALLVAGAICIYGGRLTAALQIIMAVLLIGGIVFCAAFIFSSDSFSISSIRPHFAQGKSPVKQVLQIVVLAPWAYAGYESIAHSSEEFNVRGKKSFPLAGIIIMALITSVAAYSLLSLIAASAVPSEYTDWIEYTSDLDNLGGIKGLATFNAANTYMGKAGVIVIGVAAVCGIMTGLVGNLIAASRLIYSLSRDDMLPSRLMKLNDRGVPCNALIVILIMSIPIPLFGRTAIGWIIDVNTIGATIAYAYTSAAAFRAAGRADCAPVRMTGTIGFVISLAYTFYFLVPNFWSVSVLSTESYLIFILWSIMGFVAFRYVFMRDKKKRFGKSTVVWLSLLFLIFFLSMLWFREATKQTTAGVLDNLDNYNTEELAEHGIYMNDVEKHEADRYLQMQMDIVDSSMQFNSGIQMATIMIALFIMFSIYNAMMRRESRMEIEKVKAEENSKAKSVFLSNMSHDIRTPMNAIIGYTELARDVENMPPEGAEYLEKIESSSKHLLALINDVLDMSRIESGRMELEIGKADLRKLIADVKDMFTTQMKVKKINFEVNADDIKNPYVMCDSNRLNRVLLNLISNAYKFTEEGGTVSVTLKQVSDATIKASYELRVRDTGMGMSQEFASHVFESYTREKSVSQIQGTGLGMAITKSLVDLMGGSIKVETEKEKGTEFILLLSFAVIDDKELVANENRASSVKQLDYSKIRLLLVEDQPVNMEIALRILKKFGFMIDSAENGEIAVQKVSESEPGFYQAVLMDIQMPVMNGYDATRAIRALPNEGLAKIPVIAMTANAFAEDIEEAKKAGMNSHISKPIDINKMIETLGEVLG